ncbi:DUF72 domain-containing protein [Faecalibacter rhinopitheci]|uniref:DUF72 domain-containing protein n=1 Tax=Faecalibacter rhinopitheci TaxID=2779678 RepID=A0A8J7FTH6_9FLAO|nr:DUF72 domain-containing protein [Faecalibacter rhinopitheci]MBF0596156.1 DUF72 domain-containing protein [Faecalibacter rhinopitheci]
MKFGKVESINGIDFKLPPIPLDTFKILEKFKQKDTTFEVYVGAARWSKQDLKGFFPPKTKDELTYYSTQFNAIEMNGTFYSSPKKEQIVTWKNKTPVDFKFFPKVPQTISHYNRLLNVKEKLWTFLDAITLFEEKLGIAFLQMHDNYKPKDLDRLIDFVENFPKGYPFAIEVRNEEWFQNQNIFDQYALLLENNLITNVIVDTPGRRDILHMRLTSPHLFVRFVSAYDPIDYKRLDNWIEVIKQLKEKGLQSVNFFIHQGLQGKEELYATYFIEKLNDQLGINIRIPSVYHE